ncbi:uncharacterized protein LOC118455981 [Neolamprologus brichardi]|uniref:uncharacterized protein LOC118455981 n=1 Tax=Neolamprologus brichardi TaxID=32507 RepID=UPI001643DA18|nr:uncharacterized protein LOC118455981 [Neolamprologus brichardi]
MGSSSSKTAAPSQLLENPWRQINYGENPTDQHFVENYKPRAEEQNLRILLHGPVGAGKSSFINSVNSVLQKRIRCDALVANSCDCFTKKYTTYRIKKGHTFYPFVLNDMVGLKDTTTRRNRRIHVKDVKQALKGHIKDGYVFHPENKLSKGDRYYNRTPTENDKVHVLVCVVDANTVSLMSDATVEAIQDVRDEATELEIPQVAIFTKIDEAFPEINHDVTNVYRSKSLQERIELFSKRVGIPINFIFPVKNYHSERELNPDIDAIIMNAMRHIIDIGNDSLNTKLRPQTETSTAPAAAQSGEKGRRDMSAVWNFFKVNENDKTKADCKLCSAKLSRGGSKGSAFNTSNLIKHLKSQQDNEYKEFTHASRPTQPTLQQTLARREKMSRDNLRAVKITQAIIEYIALSDQPLSEVENVGFLHLLHVLEPRYDVPSCHYMTDTELPKLHESVKKHIHSLLQVSSVFSFTTDIWTSSVSPVLLISPTSQWIDEFHAAMSHYMPNNSAARTPARL